MSLMEMGNDDDARFVTCWTRERKRRLAGRAGKVCGAVRGFKG